MNLFFKHRDNYSIIIEGLVNKRLLQLLQAQ